MKNMSNETFDFFKKRMNINGSLRKDREINRLKDKILRYKYDSPSLKDVLLNGNQKQVFIDSSSDFNTFTIKSLPDDFFFLGDIIFWENCNWLVTSIKEEKNIYTKGKMQKCVYILKWLNEDGNIDTCPCVIKNGTSETEENSFIVFGINKMVGYVPYNKSTLKIFKGQRFFIDNNTLSPTPYKIVGVDNVTNVNDDHGYIVLTFDEDVLVKEDNVELMICNYYDKKQEEEETEDKYSRINKNIGNIVLGYKQGTIFSADFIENNEVQDNITPNWSVECSQMDLLNITYKDRELIISASEERALGMSVKVVLTDSEKQYPQSEDVVKVVSIY